jgi:acyl carrier protein
MNKENYNLSNVDRDDIGEVLVKIEQSFNISLLKDQAMKEVHTFGNLCDVIAEKVKGGDSEACTTQHAFYMLRNAVTAVTGLDKCSVKPQTRLCEVFPRENRLQIIAEIENELDLKMNLLQPRQWIVGLFCLTLVASFVICFYNWQIGIAGVLSSAISLKLSGRFGKELQVKTIGDLANKIAKENDAKVRKNAGTVKRSEIEQKVKELFVNDLHLEPVVLKRKAKF